MSEAGQKIVARGAWGVVAYARRSNGRAPAEEFYIARLKADQAKLNALFQWIADKGTISNRQKFRQVEGEVFEFKSFQMRVSCYRTGHMWFLLHGFIRKADK